MSPLSPATLDWIRSFEPTSGAGLDGTLWVGDGDVRHGVTRIRDGCSEVLFRERGDPAYVLVRAQPAFAERFFVWRLAEHAQWLLSGRRQQYPIAPERLAAASGPLRVRDGSDGGAQVVADGRVVAVFPAASREAIEFTHYGYLPAELLIAQITGPTEAMIFLAGAQYRMDAEQRAEAARVRRDALALLADRA